MIKFPQQHIATSVVNRILNVHDDLESQSMRFPNMPEPLPTGEALDKKLAAPVEPVAASPEATEQVALTSAGLV